MTAPSPLVGEGFTDANHKLCWVRGLARCIPLSRLKLASLVLATLSHKGRGEELTPA